MAKVSLTELTLRSLRVPPAGQVIYWDRQLTGFHVRVSAGGAKTFGVAHGRGRQRITIGRYPLMPLADARQRARAILLAVALHPQKRPPLPFPDAVHRYFETRKAELRTSTHMELKRHFKAHFRWDKDVAEISVRDVADVLDAIAAQGERRHSYTVLKTFFKWCEAREFVAKNPLANLPKPKAGAPRERFLDRQELRAVWDATAPEDDYFLMVRLLMLTGQRCNQIASLHEDWIDYEEKVINFPAWVMKSNRQQRLPFGPLIEAHLRMANPTDGFLFSRTGTGMMFDNWGRNKKRLDEICPVRGWRHHDLRRTWATHSAQMDTAPHVIERVLAHSSGTISQIAAIYNRFKYEDQMREAILRFEDLVVQLCASKKLLTQSDMERRFIPSA
jgi:integrase